MVVIEGMYVFASESVLVVFAWRWGGLIMDEWGWREGRIQFDKEQKLHLLAVGLLLKKKEGVVLFVRKGNKMAEGKDNNI